MSRIANISIIVEDKTKSKFINDILHEHSEYIIGRMGIPYNKRNLAIISIVLDAPNNVINSIGGKIGKLDGVTTKTLYSKEFEDE